MADPNCKHCGGTGTVHTASWSRDLHGNPHMTILPLKCGCANKGSVMHLGLRGLSDSYKAMPSEQSTKPRPAMTIEALAWEQKKQWRVLRFWFWKAMLAKFASC